jgi:hypothetical protein
MLQANNSLQRVQSVRPDIDQLIDQLSTQRTGLDASGSDIKAQIESLKQLISLAREAANRLDLCFLCILCKTTVSIGAKTRYVQATVHGDKLRIKHPTRCIKYPELYFVIKLYMFQASSVPIIRIYLLYTQQLVCFMQVM